MIKDRHGEDIGVFSREKTKISDDGRIWVSNTDFSAVDLSGGLIRDVIFECCTFDDISAIGVTIENTDFDAGSFSDANLVSGNFDHVSFYAVEALDANFDKANFNFCEILGCNFADATFEYTTFENSKMAADNTGYKTSLEGSKLSTSDLSGLVFDGVEYDAGTTFPEGFRPQPTKGLFLS